MQLDIIQLCRNLRTIHSGWWAIQAKLAEMAGLSIETDRQSGFV
jgi:hypothetical protein